MSKKFTASWAVNKSLSPLSIIDFAGKESISLVKLDWFFVSELLEASLSLIWFKAYNPVAKVLVPKANPALTKGDPLLAILAPTLNPPTIVVDNPP